jgi:hypothetical protein
VSQPTRFRTDPPVSHRYAERRKLAYDPAEVKSESSAMFRRLAHRVACPICSAQPDAPCVSHAKDTPGKQLRGYHQQRVTAARDQFGRKRK